jgi:Spy/CpxP family protein refolding chaperone
MTVTSARPSRVRLALVVAAIFLAGLASGYALRSYFRPPHGSPPWLRDLNLTDEQRKASDDIFSRHRADVDLIMRDTFPKVRARNEQMEQELKAILSDAQAKKLEEIRARRHHGPGGPHGPVFDGPPPPGARGADGPLPPP